VQPAAQSCQVSCSWRSRPLEIVLPRLTLNNLHLTLPATPKWGMPLLVLAQNANVPFVQSWRILFLLWSEGQTSGKASDRHGNRAEI
jgi:hypothetical protein